MGLSLVLLQQRQSASGVTLSWTPMEGVSAWEVFVASRRMSAEELEAAARAGGSAECLVAKVAAQVTSVLDDVTPQGEPRHYGVAMLFDDGTAKAARFRATPDAGANAFRLSKAGADVPARPAAPPAPSPARVEATPARVEAPPARVEATPAREPDPPSAIPLRDRLELRMQGATQTWDGLRIHWQRDARAAAYEVIASDHQIFGDELADALAGRADFTTAVAVSPSVTAVIDNTTPREARGWYAVLVRGRDGRRTQHPFSVADAAQSGIASAPFLNPNRTGELRAEVEGMLADAREQWERWTSSQDGGARREARRLVADALLMWPGYPGARRLLAEMT